MSIPLAAEFASHGLFKSALSRSGHMHSIPRVFLFTHESFSRLISSFEGQIQNLEECPNMTVILMIQMASSKHVQPNEDRAETKIIDGYSRKNIRVLKAH